MPLPNLSLFVAGERPTAQKLNDNTINAFNAAVLYKPLCHIYAGATQSTATGALTTAQLNTVKLDTDSMADVAAFRIVIKTPGIYTVMAQAAWASNATGYRFMTVFKSGGSSGLATETFQAANGTPSRGNISVVERFNVNDYITLSVAQTSGGALNTDTSHGGLFLSAVFEGA